MALAYLCCVRQADVLNMKKIQLLPEGTLIKQSKTNEEQIKAWSPHLLSINKTGNLPLKTGISSIYIIHQFGGSVYTRNALTAGGAKEETKLKFLEQFFGFTFHDLNAKGVADLEGDRYEKRVITGHKNVEQTAVFDRRIAIVAIVGA